ncbi:secondary thiamine-phosphate synthase enzyme YjbQ [Wenzhouxiangella marina]|uniref:Secondary thiamine-phosphate synthase enzyme n=1 Tax=Wenzhouxiangella marina TaxID=1579979 RepID=A0A0K0XVS1_9GAMM|nr:secondary thiamine-phosphate synthase enzyme YjbQ [Wenzhouxiangella marina]AKS41770.1 Secondary thiamine-phosphate synthase enzyme [Wenzhouxiangella marina]MBB6086468.1 secondary thiamine-phosphate synthase enzyme [Wenzhouxiangella marina]
MKRSLIELRTQGRGLLRLDHRINDSLAELGANQGLCHLFIQHTSASLLITENADPDVHRDLETWMREAVLDGDPRFLHRAEGPDDMSAHIRSILTQTELSVPVEAGRLALGTWQGIYLWEHRAAAHRRRVLISLVE